MLSRLTIEHFGLIRRLELDLPAGFITVTGETGAGKSMLLGAVAVTAVAEFAAALKGAGTVVWNGPMGVFEIPAFSRGTMEIAQYVADAPGFSVVGGGDTIRAVRQAGIEDKISYISTGGGAFMEFMEGKTLPGVAALNDK